MTSWRTDGTNAQSKRCSVKELGVHIMGHSVMIITLHNYVACKYKTFPRQDSTEMTFPIYSYVYANQFNDLEISVL